MSSLSIKIGGALFFTGSETLSFFPKKQGLTHQKSAFPKKLGEKT